MYLHLGNSVVIPFQEVIGIFDLDNTSSSYLTRGFLTKAQQEGRVVNVSSELPKSFVVCREQAGINRVYLSQLSSATLLKRAENNVFE